ncbi:tectonic-2-like isoform X2 [Ostrea edulis]|uniref:tectonic-2-like isoform X2 n=1 Tax=Ostrea edulis TaxID=37623 RepID=UPI0024AFD194|nr:tectonic-2-like isoform X2 [Ostrea edulis]
MSPLILFLLTVYCGKSFSQNDPVLAFYPPPFTTTATKFGLLVLITNSPTNISIPLSCQADLFTSSAGAESAINNPPCGTAPTPVTTAATVTTDSSVTVPTNPDWGVLEVPALQPGRKIYHQPVKVSRNLAATAFVREYVVVSCCTTGLPNLQAATVVVADLNKNRTIDWTQAAAEVNVNSGTPYRNPAFVNISPCPCDITQNACDMDCCCDNDCTTSDRSSFRGCISGLLGGQAASYPEYYCKSSHPQKEDWFPLMCVEREYNALIGFYYAGSSTISNIEALNNKLASGSFYSYRYPTTSSANQADTPYKTGVSVGSIKPSVNSGDPMRVGTVTLPQRILSGQCLTTAPVRYLMDQQSDCTFTLTRDMCNSASVFSTLFYIQSSSTIGPSCPNAFSIQGSPSDTTATETDVKYFCTSDFSGYVKDINSNIPDVTTSTLFNFTLPTDESCLDVCGNYICEENVIVDTAETTRGTRCAFDDGTTCPPVPTINGATCENVVLDVKYEFEWKGSRIVRLNATVLLGNVPLSTGAAPVEITQKYQANFNHQYDANGTVASDNYREVTTAFDRSTGYDFGKLLQSGVEITNLTDNSFLYINTNTSQQIAVWDTGVNGLCFGAGRKLIEFGKDVSTSCLVKLSLDDLRNCSNVRKTLINRLNHLMKASKIGRLGNSNYLNLGYWIDVAREDISAVCTGFLDNIEDVTNNSKLSYEAQGLCVDIISGIHLDIMYAVTGKINATAIYEVIGARISYIKSEWQLRCTIGDMNACNTPGYVETFEVTSSVRFILVPGNTPERIPRYKDSKYSNICSQDICWEAFIYPLSSRYEGIDKDQILVQVLLVIVILVGFLVFLRPWWYIL